MKEVMKFRVNADEVTMPNGETLMEADFERMADEAQHSEPDYDAVFARARAKGGRPSLGDGVSPVLQIRIDEPMRQQLAERAEREHTTPSGLAREVLQAFLAS